MTSKGNLAMTLIVLTFFGCGETVQTFAASPQESASRPMLPGTRVEYITDPSMNNANAIAVTIPEKWHFQGVLFQAGSLPAMPYFVFRASSPDGLSFAERLPRLCWNWGSGPHLRETPRSCLRLDEPMNGQGFLRHLATMLNVEYVADVPIPAEVNAARQRAAQAQDKDWKFFTVSNTSELVSAIVHYQNGTFPMKGLLGAVVDCHRTNYPGMRPTPYRQGVPPSAVYGCEAAVRYTVAPEDQFEAVRKLWDPAGMGGQILPQWDYAMGVRIQKWGEMVRAQQNQMMQTQLQIQQQQFDHDQAVRQQMHEQFLSTMQRGTDMSMARSQAGMNARSTATSDWVDYALNQRTVMDPSSGQLTKVSTSYSYTWRDSTGQHVYQTTDPNANPNGTMPGSWTKQQVVHGDGRM